MSRNRIRTIFFVLGLVTLSAVVSWFAGSSIKSPAEVAARTAPPPASPILVPIEERVLTSDIVTRGTARFGLPQAISIIPSALKPDIGVVSTAPLRNSQLKEGDVVLTASGRPVFVLQGEIPAFRDFVPGQSGNDVRQLETALERLGFDPGAVDGQYDEQTSQAVAEWYQSAGWEPFGPTSDQLATLHTLEQELAAAINTKLAAETSVAGAPLAVEAARADADNANALAAADVAAKAATRARVVEDPTSTSYDRAIADAELSVAQTTITSTRLTGEVAIQAAIDAQHAAEREVETARALVAQLTADLDLVRSKTGMQVPADEVVFIPTLPARIEQVNVAIGDAASGTLMTVTNHQLIIDSSVRLEEAPLVKTDMAVAIDEPDLGIKATGVVGTVADTPGTFGVDGFHIYLEVLVDETPTRLEGVSLRLTIPVESTGGAVLAVPVSALSLAADGSSRVQVDNDGTLEFITVEPGLSADGFVEVTPVEGKLTPGQLVVVGFEKPL